MALRGKMQSGLRLKLLGGCRSAGEGQELSLRFPASDSYDYLNFVIKETTTNSW